MVEKDKKNYLSLILFPQVPQQPTKWTRTEIFFIFFNFLKCTSSGLKHDSPEETAASTDVKIMVMMMVVMMVVVIMATHLKRLLRLLM